MRDPEPLQVRDELSRLAEAEARPQLQPVRGAQLSQAVVTARASGSGTERAGSADHADARASRLTVSRAKSARSTRYRAGGSASEPPRRTRPEFMRELAPQPQQIDVELFPVAPHELRALEAVRELRVGHLTLEACEVLKLASSPLSRRIGDHRVDVVREEAKRCGLAVLLALKEQRRIRTEKDNRSGDAALAVREPVTERAVADLVMVLGGRDDPWPFGSAQLRRDARHRAVEPRVVSRPALP